MIRFLYKSNGEMNGNSLLLDTNIVLYLLDGDQTLVSLLEEKQLYLSFVSELELLSYKIKEAEIFFYEK